MVNTAFALKFTTPCKLASKCGIYHLLIFPQFALFCTIFAPSKFVQIQFFMQCDHPQREYPVSIKSRSWPLQTTKNQNQKYLGQKVNQRPFFRIPSKQQGASFKLISNHSCCYKPNRVTNQFFGGVRGGFQSRNTHVTIISGFVQIFGSKSEDFFQTFFQNKNFFFKIQGCQIGDHQRP